MKEEIDRMETLVETGKIDSSQSRQLSELKYHYQRAQTESAKEKDMRNR
jgi:hypothetical protein